MADIYKLAASCREITYFVDEKIVNKIQEQARKDLKFVREHFNILINLQHLRDLKKIDEHCNQLKKARSAYLKNRSIVSFYICADTLREITRPEGLQYWAPDEDLLNEKNWDEYDFECRWSLVHAERWKRDLERDTPKPKRNHNSQYRKKLRTKFNYKPEMQVNI